MALLEELESQGNWLFRFRGVLPIFLLSGGLGYYVWTEVHGYRPFPEDSVEETVFIYCCMGVSLLGLAIRIYVVGYTPANTSGRNTTKQVAAFLNQTGLYSVVRHPLYLGNYLMWLGVGALTASIWFTVVFTLVYWIYYERIMFAEEQFLRHKFGSSYIEWSTKTPAFFPDFKLFIKPALPFSWKKALKQEKNGFAALFLVFFLFYSLGEYAEGEKPENNFLLSACIFALLIYFILKIIKSNTHLLDEKGR